VADALRILFAAPAYYPALAFGGPIWAERELAEGLVRRGHDVDVLTTSLVDVRRGLTAHSRTADLDGVRVHYLATPLRYRWMGITPTLPVQLRRVRRPDVAHVFGFRDVVSTLVAGWCRRAAVPYVFEPLGMFLPRVRKVRFKRAFDRTVVRGVAHGAAIVVASSEQERAQLIGLGLPDDRVVDRGNGFPTPDEMPAASGELREHLGIGDAPLVLYVGRIASGKGIEHLLAAARALPDVHVVLAGPDDGHGTIERVHAAQSSSDTAGRIHRVQPHSRPLALYAEADVLALPSAGESFGMVAAEAAAAGTPVIVTDRCGIADALRDRAALVVPYGEAPLRDAIGKLLADRELRERLGRGGRELAAERSWTHVVELQEELYRRALA
jgi:glycosyltransferase involved in cell wall biosynthesis